jgi:Outer membrane protein beta-barrel domain
MKKILLLFLIIVVFSGGLMAQESESSSLGSKFYIGAKGAYGIVDYESIITSETNFSEMTFDNISYGILFGYNITGKLGLQLEANYSRYGADKIIETYLYSPSSPVLQSYGESSVVDHVNMDLYYIDVPLLAKYTFSELGFSPYIYIGANWGINVLGNTTIVRKITEGEEVYRNYKDDITSRIRYYDIAPVAGLGAKINMGSLSLLIDARYKHGFMNLSNVDNGMGFTNRALWVSVGLVYNL